MPQSIFHRALPLSLILLASGLSLGCAGPNPADPWEKTNRAIYNFNEGLDKYAVKPLADGYTKVVPTPIRNGIGNGFDNLTYFNVVANDFLQGKNQQGLGDAARMAVNSTIGIAGFFDVATGWKLPAHDNDLGLTLRKWGVKPGPYLVVPLFGPSTTTDCTRYGGDYVCNPTSWLSLPLWVNAVLYTADTVDLRSRYDNIVRFRNDTAVDPYVFTREAYLQYRLRAAADGKTEPSNPANQSGYDEDDSATTTPNPATAPVRLQK